MNAGHALLFDMLPPNAFILGTFGAAHLGDTLCTSTLPRLVRAHTGRPVYVVDHPMLRAVFSENPHVSGFVAGRSPTLDRRMRGDGHVVQRMEQAFEVPVSPVAKPDIYLSDLERAWASTQRKRLPADRPVCVLSTTALTDRGNAERVNWLKIVQMLCFRFTVVQPVLAEQPVPGAVPYRSLTIRQYMALMAVADAFIGATSGGTHVAAAFDVPSLVVSWRSLLDPLRFPVSGLGMPTAFLYPQHWHVAAEDLSAGSFREPQLRGLLEEMMRHGRSGRPRNAGHRRAGPCGFAPAAPRRILRCGNRFLRLPVETRR
jgi:hypothetical protein